MKKNQLPLGNLKKGFLGSDISVSLETQVGICQSEDRGEKESKGGIWHPSVSKGHPVCRGSEIIEGEDPDVFEGGLTVPYGSMCRLSGRDHIERDFQEKIEFNARGKKTKRKLFKPGEFNNQVCLTALLSLI